MSNKIISIDEIDEKVCVAELDASMNGFNANLEALSNAHPNLFALGWVVKGSSKGTLGVMISTELQSDVCRQCAAEAARVLARTINKLPPPLRVAFEDELRAIQATRMPQDAPAKEQYWFPYRGIVSGAKAAPATPAVANGDTFCVER